MGGQQGEMVRLGRPSGRARTVRLADLDERCGSFLNGTPASELVHGAAQLAGADFSGHPRAALVVGSALLDRDPRDVRVRPLLSSALEQLRAARDQAAVVVALRELSRAERMSGEYASAFERIRDADELAVAEGADRSLLPYVGLSAFHAGDVVLGKRLMHEALGHARVRGDHQVEINAVSFLGLVAYSLGSLVQAERLAGEAIRLSKVFGLLEPTVLVAHCVEGSVHAVRGEWQLCDDAFDRADSLARELAFPTALPTVAWMWAAVAAHRDPDRAARATATIETAIPGSDPSFAGFLHFGLGCCLAAAGDAQGAEAELAEAIAGLPNAPLKAQVQLRLGESRLARGDTTGAVGALAEARELFEELHADYWIARTYVSLAEALPDEADRWRAAAVAISDGDPAFKMLGSLGGTLRIKLAGVPAVWVSGERVEFATRHAELTLYALVLAGGEGVPTDELCRGLWPFAPPGRINARLRTTLWQLRSALGPESWRVRRRAKSLVIDLAGAELDIGAPAGGEGGPDAAGGPGSGGGPAALPDPPLLLRGWEDEAWVLDLGRAYPGLVERTRDAWAGASGAKAAGTP